MEYYTIIRKQSYDEESMWNCGVYNDFYKAIGNLVCIYEDEKKDWLDDGYKILEDKQFQLVNNSTERDYYWFTRYQKPDGKGIVDEYWYLLWCGSDDNEESKVNKSGKNN